MTGHGSHLDTAGDTAGDAGGAPSAADAPEAGLDKAGLRAWARARRRAAALRAGPDHGARLAVQALDHVPLPRDAVVAGYWPLAEEADPRPLLAALAARGQALALPFIRAPGHPLGFRRWQPGDPLQPGPFGTAEPHRRLPEVVPGVVLVPGLWFDRAGNRLGYGGGYYDRTLAALRRGRRIEAVGLAFAAQTGGRLPAEAHDAPVDRVVTERGAWRTRRGA